MRQVSMRSSMRSTCGTCILKCCHSSVLAALGVPSFLVVIGVEDGDEVVELAAPQRIMHEVRARAGPEHDVGPPEIFRHVLALEHAAIGDMARRRAACRRRRGRSRIFDHMPSQPISARPSTVSPLLSVTRDAVAMILVGVDAPARLQRDQVAALAGLEKGAVDVGAMGHRVRLAELFEESIAQRNIGDEFAGERVAHFLCRWAMRVGQDCILQADFFEHAKDIGAELDAGADLAEFGRLLEKADRKALMGKRVGGDQAANAAAGNKKRGGAIRRGHGVTSITNAREADHKT